MQMNIVRLNTEVASLKTEKEATAKAMTSLEDKLRKLEEEKKDLEEKIKALEDKLEEEEEEEKAKKEQAKKEEAAVVVAVKESVDKRVAQKLASLGVAAGTVKEEVTSPGQATEQAIYDQYNTLTGTAKVAFFKKNERAIFNVMNNIHYKPIGNSLPTQF